MSPSNILLYQTEDGQTRFDIRLEGETLWLTEATTCKDYLQVRQEGPSQVERDFQIAVDKVKQLESDRLKKNKRGKHEK